MVGIIITAYNVEQYIEQAIKSVLNQTYANTRIYIVDDCSTDGTKTIAEKLLVGHTDDIILIRHPENLGAGQARRTGIDRAVAEGCEWILTLDADDWMDHDFLEALIRRADETGAQIVSGGITVERGEGRWEATCYGSGITEGKDRVIKHWGNQNVFMNNKIIHRSVAEKVPYCARRFVEDTPTIIPMMYHAEKVAYTPHVGYHYRMQPESLTHTSSPLRWAIYRALCADDLMRFFESQPDGSEWLALLPLSASFAEQVNIIKQLRPTPEDVKPYQDDFADLACRIVGRLN